MVYPLLLLSPSTRWFLSLGSSAMHFVCFLATSAGFVYSALIYLLSKDSVVPLIDARNAVAAYVPIVAAFLLAATAFLHLYSWVFLKDLQNCHTRWRPTAIRDGVIMCVVAVALTLTVLALFSFMKFKLPKYLGGGFFQGMLAYNESSSLKAAVDRVQTRFSCCGIDALSDWTKLHSVDLHGDANPYARSAASWAHCRSHNGDPSTRSCYIPFSCCRPEENSCSPWAMTLHKEFGGLPNESMSNFFHDSGCLQVVSSQLFPWQFLLALGVLLVLQLLAAIGTQLAATAVRVLAEVVPDTEEVVVPGWLLPVGKYPANVIVEHARLSFAKRTPFDLGTLDETLLRVRDRQQRQQQQPRRQKAPDETKGPADLLQGSRPIPQGGPGSTSQMEKAAGIKDTTASGTSPTAHNP